jgi:two-component system invasion response regulator UvrY
MNIDNISVLLVDDHELVRSGIQYLLDADPDIDVVAAASSGEEAIQLAGQLKPNVILMDLNMPGIGGSEAIKRILRRTPSAKIIALSVYDDGPIPHQALKLGARGYINKGCPVDEMIIAIKIVDGHKISDIAAALSISPKTVNTHRYRVHEKLGISNDIELVKLAVEHGLLGNL